MYKKFSELLLKTNKTIYRVAKDTGIATATLYDWKDGKSKPKVEKLKVLADYFGVSVEYFGVGGVSKKCGFQNGIGRLK